MLFTNKQTNRQTIKQTADKIIKHYPCQPKAEVISYFAARWSMRVYALKMGLQSMYIARYAEKWSYRAVWITRV